MGLRGTDGYLQHLSWPGPVLTPACTGVRMCRHAHTLSRTDGKMASVEPIPPSPGSTLADSNQDSPFHRDDELQGVHAIFYLHLLPPELESFPLCKEFRTPDKIMGFLQERGRNTFLAFKSRGKAPDLQASSENLACRLQPDCSPAPPAITGSRGSGAAGCLAELERPVTFLG